MRLGDLVQRNLTGDKAFQEKLPPPPQLLHVLYDISQVTRHSRNSKRHALQPHVFTPLYKVAANSNQTKIWIWICTARYRGIQIRPKSQFELVPRDTEEFEFLDFDQLTQIFPPFRISICIPMSSSSLIFAGTGCKACHGLRHRMHRIAPLVPLGFYPACWGLNQPSPSRLRHRIHMGWLRLVGSFKLYVSFAEYCLFYRALLQKRPIILRSLLIVATP